jgi:Ni/Fe-hydrogenase subunit HybB-like protein
MSARWSVGSALAIALLVALSVVGALAYRHQLVVGEVATGLGTLGAGGAVWGLYVVADGCLLGAGVALMACACLARFSRDRDMEAAARIAMPVALTCFLAAALCVLADQGRPAAGLVNLAHYARPQSPFFATFTGVAAVCLFGSLVHCVLARRPDLAEYAKRPSRWQRLQRLLAVGYRGSAAERTRRQQVGFWMSLVMLALLAVPFGALAIIFTVRPGRPLLLVVDEAVAFTVSSAAGGLALLLLAAALVARIAGPRAGLGARGFARLGRGLLLLDALAVLTAVAVEITAFTSGDAAAVACAEAVRAGAYAPLLWSELGLFFLAASVLWWAARRARLRWRTVVVASALSLAAVCLQRHIGLLSWQTHGLLLPYRPGSYSPSGVEIAVLLGILAFAVLMLLPAVRLIPFAPAVYDERPVAARGAARGRTLAAGLWLCTGLCLAGAGLLLSLRTWTKPFLDPLVPASPVIFMAGLAFLLTAGAVYELLPDGSASPAAGEPAQAAPPRSPAVEA